MGENCSASCQTKDHATFGECMRAKNLRVGWARDHLGIDLTRQKKWDARLREYREARRQGIQPQSTKLKDIREAVRISNESGVAYRADA